MTVQSDLFEQPKRPVVDAGRRRRAVGPSPTEDVATPSARSSTSVMGARKPTAVFPRPPNGLMRVREAAARLGLSKSTLDKMRCDGRGPRFVKVTSKIVGYDPADLDAYAEARKRQPTSDG